MKFRLTTLIPGLLLATVSLAPALELKDITYTTEGAGQVVFSHKRHLGKKSRKNPNLSCKVCHAAGIEKNVRYTMADMEKGKSCGMCHNGIKAFSVARCTECHTVKDITYKVAETGPTLFKHSVHLKKSTCTSCHPKIYKDGPNPKISMAEMKQGKGCGACHNGTAAFGVKECSRCHPTKDIVYKVAGLGKVTFDHGLHMGAYSCESCHPKVYKPLPGNKRFSMSDMEAGKSCGACHDGKTTFTVKGSCDRCH